MTLVVVASGIVNPGPKKTLAELLEWRASLAEQRLTSEYLEELRRLCAEGLIEVVGRPVSDDLWTKFGDPQPVPLAAFTDYQLVKASTGTARCSG